MSSMISERMRESMRWPSAQTSSYGPLGMQPAFPTRYADDAPFYARHARRSRRVRFLTAALRVADTSATPPSIAGLQRRR